MLSSCGVMSLKPDSVSWRVIVASWLERLAKVAPGELVDFLWERIASWVPALVEFMRVQVLSALSWLTVDAHLTSLCAGSILTRILSPVSQHGSAAGVSLTWVLGRAGIVLSTVGIGKLVGLHSWRGYGEHAGANSWRFVSRQPSSRGCERCRTLAALVFICRDIAVAEPHSGDAGRRGEGARG